MIGQATESLTNLNAVLVVVAAIMGLALVCSQFLHKVLWVDRARGLVCKRHMDVRVQGSAEIRAVREAAAKALKPCTTDTSSSDDMAVECKISIRVSDVIGEDRDPDRNRVPSDAHRHFYDLFVWAGVVGRFMEALLVLSLLVIWLALVSLPFLSGQVGLVAALVGAGSAAISVIVSELIKHKHFPEIWDKSIS